jgi:hypothetical protein
MDARIYDTRLGRFTSWDTENRIWGQNATGRTPSGLLGDYEFCPTVC